MTIDVIVATDGENSHPDSPTHTQDQLARQRRDEATAAVARLDPHAMVTFLGCPTAGCANAGPTLRRHWQSDYSRIASW